MDFTMLIYLLIPAVILFICIRFYKSIVQKKDELSSNMPEFEIPPIPDEKEETINEETDPAFDPLEQFRGKKYINAKFTETKIFVVLDDDNLPMPLRIPNELYDAICAKFMIVSFENTYNIQWFRDLLAIYKIELPGMHWTVELPSLLNPKYDMSDFQDKNLTITKEFGKTGVEYKVSKKEEPETEDTILDVKYEDLFEIAKKNNESKVNKAYEDLLFKKKVNPITPYDSVVNVNGLAGVGHDHYEVYYNEKGFHKVVLDQKEKFDSYIETFGEDTIPNEKEYKNWDYQFELSKSINNIKNDPKFKYFSEDKIIARAELELNLMNYNFK